MDKFEELKKYKELLDEGVISEDDFKKKKKSLLESPEQTSQVNGSAEVSLAAAAKQNELYQQVKQTLQTPSSELTVADLEALLNKAASLGDYRDAKHLTNIISNKIDTINAASEACYKRATDNLNSSSVEDIQGVIKLLEVLGDYKNSKELLQNANERLLKLKYEKAAAALTTTSVEDVKRACSTLEELGDYKDSKELLNKAHEWLNNYEHEGDYNLAVNKLEISSVYSVRKAIEILDRLGDYKDSKELLQRAKEKLAEVEESTYNEAVSDLQSRSVKSYKKAIEGLSSLGNYKDAQSLLENARLELSKLVRKKMIKIGLIAGIPIVLTILIFVFAYLSLPNIADDMDSTKEHTLHSMKYEAPKSWEKDKEHSSDTTDSYIRKEDGEIVAIMEVSYLGENDLTGDAAYVKPSDDPSEDTPKYVKKNSLMFSMLTVK